MKLCHLSDETCCHIYTKLVVRTLSYFVHLYLVCVICLAWSGIIYKISALPGVLIA